MSAADRLLGRAQGVQDLIGWADYTDAEQMASATLDLSRIVVELARELQQVKTELQDLRSAVSR